MKVGDLIMHKEYGWIGVVVEVWPIPWKNAKVYWVVDAYDSVCLLSSLIPCPPPS
jgi:heat shock protein HspQ